jgi:hypothetical protein
LIVSNQDEWKLFQLYNTSYYGQTIMRFAQRWANEMEKRLNDKKTFDFVTINNCFDLANLKEGVTRNQISAAIEVLTKCWPYGGLLEGWLDEYTSQTGSNRRN